MYITEWAVRVNFLCVRFGKMKSHARPHQSGRPGKGLPIEKRHQHLLALAANMV
jgi:hypothetical protein